MQIVIRLILFINIVLLTLSFGYSQKEGGVQIKRAKRAKGTVINGESVTKLYGDVYLKKKDVDFYCDSAVRYEKKNDFIAYGHVKMYKGDSVKLFCDKLHHIGKTGVSKCTGDVKLKDKTMTLTTHHLDYNKTTDVSYYYDGGVVVDGEVTLTSESGIYDVNTKLFNFYTDVLVIQPDNKINSDTLRYNRLTGVTYFDGPTTIKSKKNDLYAEKGEYHTNTEDSYFSKNAVVETPKYILKGDSIYYNNISEDGHVFGKVIIESKKDSLLIFGEEAIRKGLLGTVKVFGERTLMEKIQDSDTTYILADTLYSIEDTIIKEQERILAYHDVKIYKQGLEGVCDSLVYDFKDSTILFFNNPIMWNGENQIFGDTVEVLFSNEKIDKVYTNGHSFTIKKHHGEQFDQIKGRQTVAYFNDDKIDKVKVFGNGECLYYVNDDEEKTFTGLNRIECSRMTVKFFNNELSDITFISLPDAHFYPPQRLNNELSFLAGYVWYEDKRPLLQEFRDFQAQYIDLPEKEVITEVKEVKEPQKEKKVKKDTPKKKEGLFKRKKAKKKKLE